MECLAAFILGAFVYHCGTGRRLFWQRRDKTAVSALPAKAETEVQAAEAAVRLQEYRNFLNYEGVEMPDPKN